jgi:hypothetical protein
MSDTRRETANAEKRRRAKRSAMEKLEAIRALPDDMRDSALVDWQTATILCSLKDVEHCRDVLKEAGLPLVELTARRKLPTWGALKALLKSRETIAA